MFQVVQVFFSIIEKHTGEENKRGFFHARQDEVMLYSTFENDKGSQELRLLDFRTNTDNEITKFKDLTCKLDEEWFADCIHVKEVTENKIELSMSTVEGEIEFEKER